MPDKLLDELQKLFESNEKRFNGPLMEQYDNEQPLAEELPPEAHPDVYPQSAASKGIIFLNPKAIIGDYNKGHFVAVQGGKIKVPFSIIKKDESGREYITREGVSAAYKQGNKTWGWLKMQPVEHKGAKPEEAVTELDNSKPADIAHAPAAIKPDAHPDDELIAVVDDEEEKDKFIPITDDPTTQPVKIIVTRRDKNNENQKTEEIVPNMSHPDVLFGNPKYKDAYKTKIYLPGLAAQRVKDENGKTLYDKKTGRALYEPIVMGKNKDIYLINYYVLDDVGEDLAHTKVNKNGYKKSGRTYIKTDMVEWDSEGEPFVPYNKVSHAKRQQLKAQPHTLTKNISPDALGIRTGISQKDMVNPEVNPGGVRKPGLDNTLGRKLRRGVAAGATEFQGEPATTFNKTGATMSYGGPERGKRERIATQAAAIPTPPKKGEAPSPEWTAYLAKRKADLAAGKGE